MEVKSVTLISHVQIEFAVCFKEKKTVNVWLIVQVVSDPKYQSSKNPHRQSKSLRRSWRLMAGTLEGTLHQRGGSSPDILITLIFLKQHEGGP